MRGRAWAGWAMVMGALLGACSSSEPAPDAGYARDAAPSDAGALDGGPPDARPRPWDRRDAGLGRVWFQTVLLMSDEDTPVVGASVCELDAVPENCVTSSDSGWVEISIPASTDVVLEYSAEGFRPFLQTLHLDFDASREPYSFFTEEEDGAYFAPAGGIADGEGQLSMTFMAGGRGDLGTIGGATAEIVVPAGHPVLYATSTVALDPARTATSGSGLASAAQLAPGIVQLLGHDVTGAPCRPRFRAFAEPAPDAGVAPVIAVPILVGHETRIDLVCGL